MFLSLCKRDNDLYADTFAVIFHFLSYIFVFVVLIDHFAFIFLKCFSDKCNFN